MRHLCVESLILKNFSINSSSRFQQLFSYPFLPNIEEKPEKAENCRNKVPQNFICPCFSRTQYRCSLYLGYLPTKLVYVDYSGLVTLIFMRQLRVISVVDKVN